MFVKKSSIFLDKDFVNSYKDKPVPWGPVGYVTYKRTYARYSQELNRTEEWHETIERAINGAIKIGTPWTKEESEKLYDYMFNLKGLLSGRGLWSLGSKTVDKIGGDSLLNCWYKVLEENPVESFCFIFNELMLGGGVGFTVEREHVYRFPKIKKNVVITRRDTNDADFIVPDSREGWVNLLRKVLNAFFNTGEGFTYSTVCIRGKDTIIKSFGGKASGPESLCEGLEDICSVLTAREGKNCRSVDALDICNIIGQIVVSGNVRRSAQIAVGDMDDRQFLKAKRWDLGNVPRWRAMSNNTIVCNDVKLLTDEYWDMLTRDGEVYGLFNKKLCRSFGRVGHKKRDSTVDGINPCAESTLADGENCNLAEIYLSRMESYEEMKEVTRLLYMYCKQVSSLNFLYDKTNKVVHKNMRLGLGLTGICEATAEQEKWAAKDYDYLEDFDKKYSDKRGWPASVKLTVIKPSGTLSLLAGVTPGIHPSIFEHYIRRIRFSSNDPLVPLCRDAGFNVEPQIDHNGNYDHNTMVIEFPCKASSNAILAKNMSAIDQLELQAKYQEIWADNSVSCTVYFKKEEAKDIEDWLVKNYNKRVKTVSFMLHKDHGFSQAPYEEITEEEYNKLIKSTKPIDRVVDKAETELVDSLECEGGACPVK